MVFAKENNVLMDQMWIVKMVEFVAVHQKTIWKKHSVKV